MAETLNTGKKGELIAGEYLKAHGYTILNKNWRSGRYEIDIIATRNNEITFIEVKTRSDNFLVEPEVAVNKTKIKRIIATANAYIRYFRIDLDVRFDIITIILNKDTHRIKHLEDAFEVPLSHRK